jgi:hypothetical protein
MTDLQILSTGAPHVYHADRITANMMKHLAKQHAALWQTIHEITKDPRARDGNKFAQMKIAERVRKAGASHVILTPGKRGRYHMGIYSWRGFSPATDSPIEVDDPLPSKPWLAQYYYTVEGLGNYQFRTTSRPVVFRTHHCLSRVTQRWQARDLDDMLRVINSLGMVALKYIIKANDRNNGEWHITPPDGVKVPMNNNTATMILKQHETRPALICATIY